MFCGTRKCQCNGLSADWSNPCLLVQIKPKTSFMSLQGHLWRLDTGVTSQTLPAAGPFPQRTSGCGGAVRRCCSLSALWAEVPAHAYSWTWTCSWYKQFGYQPDWERVLDELRSTAGGRGPVSQPTPDTSACGECLSPVHPCPTVGGWDSPLEATSRQSRLVLFLENPKVMSSRQSIHHGVPVLWDSSGTEYGMQTTFSVGLSS